MKQESGKKRPLLYLSPPALILPLSRTLSPSTGVKVVEGGSVRETGRIKAGGERTGKGVFFSLACLGRRTEDGGRSRESGVDQRVKVEKTV
jgi:hypothetical protein